MSSACVGRPVLDAIIEYRRIRWVAESRTTGAYLVRKVVCAPYQDSPTVAEGVSPNAARTPRAIVWLDVLEPEVAAAGQDVSELSLAHGAHAAPMIDRLDDFHRSNPDALIDFPPKLQTVPCKPLLFDLARNEIAYPDIGDRVKSKSRSWLGGKASSWFGRG